MKTVSLVKNEVFNNIVEYFKTCSTEYVFTKGLHFVFSDIAFPFNNICLIPDGTQLTFSMIDNIIHLYSASNATSFSLFIESEKLAEQTEDYLQTKELAKGSSFSGLIKELNQEQYNVELPTNLKIETVNDPQQLRDWITPFKRGFGYSDDAAFTLFKHLIKSFTTNNIKHFVLFHHDQPIGCASVFVDGTTAGFYNLTVMPEFRYKGLGQILQKVRLNFALEKKCKIALMQAAAVSTHMAKKLGFRKVTNFIHFYRKIAMQT